MGKQKAEIDCLRPVRDGPDKVVPVAYRRTGGKIEIEKEESRNGRSPALAAVPRSYRWRTGVPPQDHGGKALADDASGKMFCAAGERKSRNVAPKR